MVSVLWKHSSHAWEQVSTDTKIISNVHISHLIWNIHFPCASFPLSFAFVSYRALFIDFEDAQTKIRDIVLIAIWCRGCIFLHRNYNEELEINEEIFWNLCNNIDNVLFYWHSPSYVTVPSPYRGISIYSLRNSKRTYNLWGFSYTHKRHLTISRSCYMREM